MPRWDKSVASFESEKIPLGTRMKPLPNELVVGSTMHKVIKDEEGFWYLLCDPTMLAQYEYTGRKGRVKCNKCRLTKTVPDEPDAVDDVA